MILSCAVLLTVPRASSSCENERASQRGLVDVSLWVEAREWSTDVLVYLAVVSLGAIVPTGAHRAHARADHRARPVASAGHLLTLLPFVLLDP